MATDQPFDLQVVNALAERWTVDGKKQRKIIVREIELVGMNPVVHVQQPARAALLDRVACVAGRELNNDSEYGLAVAPDDVVERTSECRYAAKVPHLYPFDVSVGLGDLNEGIPGRDRPIGKECFDPDHPFIADWYYLHHHGVRCRRGHNTHTTVWKVHVAYQLALPIEWLFATYCDGVQAGTNPRELVLGQCGEQFVLGTDTVRMAIAHQKYFTAP